MTENLLNILSMIFAAPVDGFDLPITRRRRYLHTFTGVDHPKAKPQFPNDHALHPKWGMEWYYLACTLEVEGTGGQDRIGVFVDFARERAVSNAVQGQSGWSDDDAQIVGATAIDPESSVRPR